MRTSQGTASRTNGLSLAAVRQVSVIAAACALIAGAIESGGIAFRQSYLGHIAFVSYDFVWMTPLSFVLWLVPPTVALFVVLALVRRPPPIAMIIGGLAGIGAFSILLPHTVIAWWASAMLAGGLGAELARRTAAIPPPRLASLLAKAAMLLLLLMAGTGALVRLTRAVDASAGSAGTPVSVPGTPNVLLIVLDTVRSSNLDLYGYGRNTAPRVTQLASEGATFDFAIATAPWTLPSHASMFTGLSADESGASWLRPMRSDAPTVAEVLRARGYATAGFVANLLYASYESGLTRGFDHYDDYQVTLPLVLRHASLSRVDVKSRALDATSFRDFWDALRASSVAPGGLEAADQFRPADRVAEAFLGWQSVLDGRPFFAFLNLFDAHGPYRAPPEYLARFDRGGAGEKLDRYDAAIAWMDAVLGRVFDALQARGVLDETIIVVTSDHGEHFGEHEIRGHANSLYLPVLHVPLVVRYPARVPAGVRIQAAVSLRNLATTILELSGAGPQRLPGTSLSAAWRDPDALGTASVYAELEKGLNVDQAFPNSRGDMWARLDNRFHYIRDGLGGEELYEYRVDPEQSINLADDLEFMDEVVRLRNGLPLP